MKAAGPCAPTSFIRERFQYIVTISAPPPAARWNPRSSLTPAPNLQTAQIPAGALGGPRVLAPSSCAFVRTGSVGCLDLWGEGVKIFLARRGSRCGWAQGAPRFYSPDVGRGDIPGAEPEARARRVFAPGGPGVRASGLRSRGAGSCGPAGWMLPRACWRQLRQIDARARPYSVAPAAARGSMESWPRPGRNRQTRRLFARGAGAGCPLGRGVRPRASGSAPRPPRLGLRGSQPREFRAPHCSTSGGRGQAGRARGLDCPAQAWTAPQFPHPERNTQGWGTPGRPRSSGF